MLSSHDCSYWENQARGVAFLQDTLLLFLGPSQGDLTQTHSTHVWGFVQLVTRCLQFYFMVVETKNFIFFTSTSAPSYFFHDYNQFSSVQSLSSVQLFATHRPQHARPPCPSPTPGVYSNSCLLSRWCHPAISSSLVPFSSCPQSFPASGSFPMSQLFAWGGQSIGVSASASVLPANTQDCSPLGWTGWISLQSQGLLKESSPTPQVKSINSLALSFLYSPTLTSIHDYWKNHSLD